MADLDNFFAKKDKKKKKPKGTARPATDAGVVGGSSSEGGASASGLSTAPKASKGDDGWIEIEDPKTAQVNTGGRTVGDFKRDADGKDGNGDGTTSGDKFSGWTKTADEDGEGEGENAVPASQYPTLADAADAPQVPKTRGQGHGSHPASGSRPTMARRPGAPNFAGLKKLLEQNAADSQTAPKPPAS